MIYDYQRNRDLATDWATVGNLHPARIVSCMALRTLAQIGPIKSIIRSAEQDGIVKTVSTAPSSSSGRVTSYHRNSSGSVSGGGGGIPRANLRNIEHSRKAALFAGYLPVPPAKTEAAEGLLARLRQLSPSTAAGFELKSGDLGCLTFRLLVAPRGPDMPRDDTDIRGYYALSYRWQSGARMVNHGKCKGSDEGDGGGGGGGDGGGNSSNGRMRASSSFSSAPFASNDDDDLAVPTSDVMFEAIMDELPAGYGLWCDQICINEADADERNKTVGMMDVIYKRADKVIVALDDIFLDDDEVAALAEFSDWHEHHSSRGRVPEDEDYGYMKTRPKLTQCVEKIVYSEYFDRAWCGHEFELASERLVLIRVQPSTTTTTTTTATNGEEGEERNMNTNHRHQQHRVVRIPNDKLHTLMLLLSLDTKASLTAEQINRRVNVELLVARSDRNDPGLRSQMVHDMQTLALISSMNAGGNPTLPEPLRPYSAIRDKAVIILNACEISLQPNTELVNSDLSVGLARSRSYQDMLLIMLACGNPLVLATTGTPLLSSSLSSSFSTTDNDDDEIDCENENNNDSSSSSKSKQYESWMRKFWLLDAGVDAEVQPLRLPMRISLDVSARRRWIKLDLVFPRRGGQLHTASARYLRHAHDFVRDYRDSHAEEMGGDDRALVAVRMEHMAHLIACVLECRKSWHKHRYDNGSCGSGAGGAGGNNNNNNMGSDYEKQQQQQQQQQQIPWLKRWGGSPEAWDYFFGDLVGSLPVTTESRSSSSNNSNNNNNRLSVGSGGERKRGLTSGGEEDDEDGGVDHELRHRRRHRSQSPLITSLRALSRRRQLRRRSGGSAHSNRTTASEEAREEKQQQQKTAMELAGRLMGNLLMTAPMPESRGDALAYRPAWFEVGDGSGSSGGGGGGQRYIAMAPRARGRYRVAVPEVLKKAKYAELPRCWVLEEKTKEDNNDDDDDDDNGDVNGDGGAGQYGNGHWIVRNRTKLIMEGDTLEPEIEKGMWWCEKDQTVWGRTKPMKIPSEEEDDYNDNNYDENDEHSMDN